MSGFIFGRLVKKLERAARDVSGDFAKSAGQEIGQLVDDNLSPFADKLDYMAQERIKKSITATEELKGKFKDDIESLLSNADGKVRQALESLSQVGEEVIRYLRETIGQTDIYLENRIDQISLAVMKALKYAQEIGSEFTPEEFQIRLVEPTLAEINVLEDKLFQDANQLVDKIDEAVEGKIELIRNELRRHLAHALPNPFDKCKQQLKIGLKPGSMLSDTELYELSECYELSKLDYNTPIDEVLKTYGQLQLNAARKATLVKNAPELKRRAIQDWFKYGVLCEFWRDTIKSYDSTAPMILEHQLPQRSLIGKWDEQNP